MSGATDRSGKNDKREIVYISTSQLIPYARNSRTHSSKQVAHLAGSIKEFGFTNPVLIDNDNGIIAGHGRVMAAELLGMDSVPCIRLAHLTDIQKRAYVIADNQLSLDSDWNSDMLALELEDLAANDYDLASIGLDALMPSINDAEAAKLLEGIGDAEEVSALAAGVRRGILIDFDAEDFDDAQQLISVHRQSGTYIGGVLLAALREQQS